MNPRAVLGKPHKAGAAKVIALGLTLLIVGGIFWLVYTQLTSLHDKGSNQPQKQPSLVNDSPKTSIIPHKFGQNVVSAPADTIDLVGEREPSEEELIREAIERYLRLLRPSEITDGFKIRDYVRLRKAFQDMLRQLPDSAIPIIKELLENEPDFVNRRLMLYGLADMGSDAAAALLRDFFLSHMADESRQSEMNHVIKALGLADNLTAFNTLMEFARNDENDFKRFRAHCVEAMGGQTLGYKAMPLFQDFLVKDMDHAVRNKSAQAIKNVAKTDPETARAALPTLMEKVRGGDPAGLGSREAQVVNDSMYVKQTSLGAIGQIGDRSAIPFLQEVGTMDATFPVRLSAAAALSRMGGTEAMTALDTVLAQQTADNQKIMVDALSQLKIPGLMPFFQDVAMGDHADPVRAQAVEGISRIGGDDAETALRAILAGERNDAIKTRITQKLKLLTQGGR